MENYDKKIEDIIKELDSIEESFFGKIGQAIKGISQGVRGEKRTDILDREAEGRGATKGEKGYATYSQSQGSDALKKADREAELGGKAQYYQIGKSKALEVDDKLKPFLHFDIDEAAESKGKLVYVANAEKTFKRNPQLEWLFKGDYEAKKLEISTNSIKGRGTIRGKAILFTGVWQSGAFMGVLKNGEINGGQIIDGYYIAKGEGFKIDPWDFKSGGMSVASGFAFGLRLAKDNTSYKSLSLVQVPSGKIIKIIDNNDKEHLIKMDRGVGYKTLNMKIDGQEVSWENYNKSESDFKQTYMTVGSNFTIPGVKEISKGIQSIEVKTAEYEGGDEDSSTEGKGKKTGASKTNKDSLFDVKTNVKGWTPGGKSGYYVLDIDVNDEELLKSISGFKEDINSGKFFKYLNFFKSLIDEGRVDGYGNNPGLSFLFPKQKGESYKSADSKRDTTIKYFNRFRDDVIDSFKSDKIANYYKNLMKKYLEEPSSGGTSKKKKPTKKATTKKPAKRSAQSAVGKVNESYKELSIVKILKESLENQ